MKSKLSAFLVMLCLGLVFCMPANALQRTPLPKNERRIQVDKEAIRLKSSMIQVSLSFGTFIVTKLGIDKTGNYYVYENDLRIEKSKKEKREKSKDHHCRDCNRDFTSDQELSFHHYTNHIYPRPGQEGEYP